MHDELTPTMPAPVPQRLGEFGQLALLAMLSAFIPLSTDIYLPALPTIAKTFGATEALVNLTLVLFFVFYSLGTLIWGPLSDKYGRKPVLLVGLASYVIASICCAFAANIYQLIAFRVLQAIAGSASPAIAVALVKELFYGRKRERGLVLIQSMVMIAPIVAPAIGSGLLYFTTWNGIFWMLAAFGVIAFVWSLALRETVTEYYTGTLMQTWGQLGTVLNNRSFTALLVIFSCTVMPLYAYLASSTYIYQDEFGLSPQLFSAFFMANAGCAVLAPFVYLAIARHVKRLPIVTGCMLSIAVAGALIATLGHLRPLVLALCIMPATLAMGIIRPPSANLMLEQQDGATGAASSLINFLMSLIGSVGMLLMSAGWHSRILPLGMVHLIAGGLCGFAWLFIARSPMIKHPPEQVEG